MKGSGVSRLLRTFAGHEPKRGIIDLKSNIIKPTQHAYNASHTGRDSYDARFSLGGHLASIKSLLSELRKDIDADSRDVTFLLPKHNTSANQNVYMDDSFAVERIDDLADLYKTRRRIDENLEWKLLDYEGADKRLLDTAKRLNDVCRGYADATNDFEEKFRQLYKEMNGPLYIGPSFMYLLLSHLRKSGQNDIFKDRRFISKVMEQLSRNRILYFDVREGRVDKESPAKAREPPSLDQRPKNVSIDKSLDDDITKLLSTIRANASLDISGGDALNDDVMQLAGVNDDSRVPDTCNVTSPMAEYASKPSGLSIKGNPSFKVSCLSCDAIASMLKVDAGPLLEIAQVLECDANSLTIEEAEFILDELNMANSIDFTKSSTSVTMQLSNKKVVNRPLVVTIMGHVDHGKTTLLDQIQKTSLASGEVGGITQTLGAFQVDASRGTLVFLDTPGHAAFGTMRSRGAKCADVVILLIAADDGIMPQTKEAIEIIKRENLPCIVVINKVDLAHGQHIFTELKSDRDVTILGPPIYISAKTGVNVDGVLDAIFDAQEQLAPTTDVNARGLGYVFETCQHPTFGKLLKVIVRNGTFRESDWIVAQGSSVKLKRLLDSNCKTIKSASPSQIIQISWPADARSNADTFVQVAKSQVHANRLVAIHKRKEANAADNAVALPLQYSALPQIKVVIKSAYEGGLDTLVELIGKFNGEKRRSVCVDYLVERGYITSALATDADALDRLLKHWNPIHIVSQAIGPFNQSDTRYIDAGDCCFLGFATSIAQHAATPLVTRIHGLVYDLASDIETIYNFHFGPTYTKKVEATLNVTQTAQLTLKGIGKCTAVGTSVISGNAKASHFYQVNRQGAVLYRELQVFSMQSDRKPASLLRKGDSNNSLVFTNVEKKSIEIKVGDELVAFTKEPLAPLFGLVESRITSK